MATPRHRVLLVENEPAVRAAMLGALGTAGLEAVGAADAAQALDVPADRRIDVVVAHYHLPLGAPGDSPESRSLADALGGDGGSSSSGASAPDAARTIDRRRIQRRAEPHAMWYTHGFIVVETPAIPTEAIQLTTSPA
jgi:CheY-like chemotaxis protein